MTSIILENVNLQYPIFGSRAMSLKTGLLNLATGGGLVKDCKVIEVQALNNINLHLKSGDKLGLIGHNGSGKTSLLKVLAQIYSPTNGKIRVSGKTNCLFDITMGLDSNCSGYENIKIKGLIAGLTNQEIKDITPDIESFAELGEFIKMPIRTYSAGMLVRLAFGIATAIHSEILLVDEVLGVGDQNFIEKAKKRMEDRIFASDIMVFSTHDVSSLRKFCNKLAWLQQGKIRAFGTVDEVLSEYEK